MKSFSDVNVSHFCCGSSLRTVKTTSTGSTLMTSCRIGGTPSTAASRCRTSTASSTSKVTEATSSFPFRAVKHQKKINSFNLSLYFLLFTFYLELISRSFLCRRPDEHVEAALVRSEGRDLPVVPGQAGGSEAGLAAQEGRRLVHAVPPKLEAPLVRAAAEQADVL